MNMTRDASPLLPEQGLKIQNNQFVLPHRVILGYVCAAITINENSNQG